MPREVVELSSRRKSWNDCNYGFVIPRNCYTNWGPLSWNQETSALLIGSKESISLFAWFVHAAFAFLIKLSLPLSTSLFAFYFLLIPWDRVWVRGWVDVWMLAEVTTVSNKWSSVTADNVRWIHVWRNQPLYWGWGANKIFQSTSYIQIMLNKNKHQG